MPGRSQPLITNQIYHVFNRGIDRRTTFSGKREFERGYQALLFYRFVRPPLRLSYFLSLGPDKRNQTLSQMEKGEQLIDVLAYCLMPNHVHLVLRQLFDEGISTYLSNIQNSYTRYFNTRHRRVGPLFLDQFKAKRVETDEQLHHLIRYVHLNPFTSFLVKGQDALVDYPWSSFPEYLGKKVGFCIKEYPSAKTQSPHAYKTFVFDQANYQRHLGEIKNLTEED